MLKITIDCEILKGGDVTESRATTLIRTEIAHARSGGDLKGYNENTTNTWLRLTRGRVKRARNPGTGHDDMIDGSVTYEQWRDGMNPEEKAAFEVTGRKYRNNDADKAQHEKYRAIFGKDVPRSIDKFQELKYNDSAKWAELKKQKQSRLN